MKSRNPLALLVSATALSLGANVLFSACAGRPTCQDYGNCPETGGSSPTSGAAGHAGEGAASGASGSSGSAHGGASGHGNAGGSTGGNDGGGSAGTAGLAGAAGATPCDGACTGATPVCDLQSNECVECTGNGDCAAPTPACDVTTHACVECTKKIDCSDAAKPQCDPVQQACVECVAQSDCTSATASACVGNACVACTKDEECSNIAGKGVCDAGACVQCTGKNFAACGQSGGTPLVCDSLKRTCSTSKQQSAGLCQTCVTDAQCKAGQMCVLDKFGNPAQDVGYFCHWKKGDSAGGAPTACSLTGKPYSATQPAVTSIDGNVSDICNLRTSTCIANNQFGAKDCTVATTPSDSLCGFAPGEDSKCAVFDAGASSYRCTMTCLVPEDCPGATCDTSATPRVCTFN